MRLTDDATALGRKQFLVVNVEAVDVPKLGQAPVLGATVRHDQRHLRQLHGVAMRGPEEGLAESVPPKQGRVEVHSHARLVAIPRSEERRVGKECRSRWS